ncbi:hypothetical protein Lnau_1331 [Legionella nautarum]|uniref:Uncharacterized protein n=1 Tax=Legionella nautarum TaxID=45070 RepID=A0A0W0WVJ7_9GAMM|nr:hypothetical protein [Legionella nautarum]KTD36347.1 hypothetical protein Lnau_1331 [Legionella nautarum]
MPNPTENKKSSTQQKPVPGLWEATYNVIVAAFKSEVTHNYVYQFPQRKTLHEKSPPHVQAVNQHLDREGIDLEQEHIEHFERGSKIDEHEVSGHLQKLRKWGKTIKNERKIADSFAKEAKEEAKKGYEADQTKITYAKAGWIAHTLFGAVKAATNPYVAHEDVLDAGSTIDYHLGYTQDKKSQM